jgi:AraC-like DNA-binding protein
MSCDHGRTFAVVLVEFHRTPGATIAQLAARLHVHRQTLAKIILDATGCPAGLWREQQVEDGVRYQLGADPTVSIKEVAAAYGFSTSGLRRFILRRCGMTPTQLRKGQQRG